MLSVIVTCHAPYLKFLGAAIASIARQGGERVQIILAMDNCPVDWQSVAGDLDVALINHVIAGHWGGPNAARNAALAEAAGDWLVFWDADNVMPPGYLARVAAMAADAGPDVGVLYPHVRVAGRRMGSREHGDPREGFFVDTCSAWRREAVLSAGGWREDLRRFDDWDLSQRVYRQGWHIQPLGVEVIHRSGHPRRSQGLDEPSAVWSVRDLGIVSLQRGVSAHWAQFLACLETLDTPPRTGLTLVDNSASAAFGRAMRGKLNALGKRFRRVTVLTVPEQMLTVPSEFEAIHCHVANLYGTAIDATPESVVLTWEDDVFPVRSDAVKQLSTGMRPGSHVGAVGAVYASRGNARMAAACENAKAGWKGGLRLDAVREEQHGTRPVGGLAGGFTLWSRPALEKVPIRSSQRTPQLGWDGDLSARLAAQGYRLMLHTDVWCEHRV